MTELYKYRPPIKYLFVGLVGIAMSAIFGIGIIKGDEIWFSIIIGVFFLMTLALGIGFLTIFFRNIFAGNLKIGDDFIEIPRRWKKKIKINFSEIKNIGEFDTYDNVIEIENLQGIYIIERNWMRKKEFDLIKKRFQKFMIEKK